MVTVRYTTEKLKEMRRRLEEATKNPKPFILTKEIIQVAMVHPNTTAIWRTSGKIKHKDKISVAYLYDRQEIIRFLENRLKKLEQTYSNPLQSVNLTKDVSSVVL